MNDFRDLRHTHPPERELSIYMRTLKNCLERIEAELKIVAEFADHQPAITVKQS